MKDIRDRETILQMIIRMRIELVESLIRHKEEDLARVELELEDPKYVHIFVQVEKAQDMGYKQGLEHELESLREIQKQVRQ